MEHENNNGQYVTASTILGPFYRNDTPVLPCGGSVIKKDVGGETAIVHEVVRSSNGKPIGGAEIHVWHTAPNGRYEQQDPEQPDFNLRGRFITDAEGRYSFQCLRPTSYSIPYDGPAGDLLKIMDRHPMRPGHIHFRVNAAGHRELITQVFDQRDEYVHNDTVFAVKDELIVNFIPRNEESRIPEEVEGSPRKDVEFELKYDIVLKELPS